MLWKGKWKYLFSVDKVDRLIVDLLLSNKLYNIITQEFNVICYNIDKCLFLFDGQLLFCNKITIGIYDKPFKDCTYLENNRYETAS